VVKIGPAGLFSLAKAHIWVKQKLAKSSHLG